MNLVAVLAALAAIAVQPALARSPPISPLNPPPTSETEGETGGSRREAAALSEARWLAPDSDIVAFLNAAPRECLAVPPDKDAASRVEAGRALFRSPLIFGGPAARYGLSCNSCHRDGRDNPHFFLEMLSGSPGTADVTSALFSKTREDGVFNPRPIPDLVGAGDKASLGSSGIAHDLESFIGSAVADEFQGAAPEAVAGALAAYVRALKPEACGAPQKIGLARTLSDLRRALDATETALAREDRAAADALFLAALQDLKRLDERFAPLPPLSAQIRGAAAELTAARTGAAISTKKGRKALRRFMTRLAELEAALPARAGDSLYDGETLAAHLKP